MNDHTSDSTLPSDLYAYTIAYNIPGNKADIRHIRFLFCSLYSNHDDYQIDLEEYRICPWTKYSLIYVSLRLAGG